MKEFERKELTWKHNHFPRVIIGSSAEAHLLAFGLGLPIIAANSAPHSPHERFAPDVSFGLPLVARVDFKIGFRHRGPFGPRKDLTVEACKWLLSLSGQCPFRGVDHVIINKEGAAAVHRPGKNHRITFDEAIVVDIHNVRISGTPRKGLGVYVYDEFRVSKGIRHTREADFIPFAADDKRFLFVEVLKGGRVVGAAYETSKNALRGDGFWPPAIASALAERVNEIVKRRSPKVEMSFKRRREFDSMDPPKDLPYETLTPLTGPEALELAASREYSEPMELFLSCLLQSFGRRTLSIPLA